MACLLGVSKMKLLVNTLNILSRSISRLLLAVNYCCKYILCQYPALLVLVSYTWYLVYSRCYIILILKCKDVTVGNGSTVD